MNLVEFAQALMLMAYGIALLRQAQK